MCAETLKNNEMPGKKRIPWKNILIYSFLFVTFVFPKAGAVIKGAPITVSTVLYGLVLLSMLPYILDYTKKHRLVAGYYLTYVFFVSINALLAFGKMPLRNYLMAMVVAGSPIAFLIGKNITYDGCMKVLCVAGMIVGLYSIAQWLFGLTQTTIPGVTLAIGDSWASKPIGYGFSKLHESTKMPSTTQNGNNVALLSVLGIGALLTWMSKGKWFYLKWTSLGLFSVALILSGSRSATYPFALLLPLGVYICWNTYSGTDKKTRTAFLSTVVITILAVAVLLRTPQLTRLANMKEDVSPGPSSFENNAPENQDGEQCFPSGEEKLTPSEQSRLLQEIGNMSGRIPAWKNMWRKLTNEYKFSGWIRIIFAGAPPTDMMVGCEGLPLFVSQYGIFASMLFMGLFIPLLKLYKLPFLWSGLAFAGALVVDSSYNYPPVLIWFFIMFAAVYNKYTVTD